MVVDPNLGDSMAFPKPPDSRSAVKRAGKAVARKEETPAELALIDQWRGSHGHALNTFQVSLRRRIDAFPKQVDFVQRLKRRNTVIDKLRRIRPDGTPLIRDVTSMNDFAGCRLIFLSIEDLVEFRAAMHKGFANHALNNSPEQYDYIENPKATGYRGVHDIYLHYPRSHRIGSTHSNQPWHGLKVEIQYRTLVQNSWATAVELADLIDGERTKFDFGTGRRGLFFRLASEIIAREQEGVVRAFDKASTERLREVFSKLEDKLQILRRLTALRASDRSAELGKHNVLNLVRDEASQYGFRLVIERFDKAADALEAANRAESDQDSINAVYVTSPKPNQLRAAYKNYFADSVSFVELLAPVQF